MKIKIEIDENCIEEETVIRCRELNEQVQYLQRTLVEIAAGSQRFPFYRGDTEYYLSLSEILFFETQEGGISVHTLDNVYQTKYKLYELEELLPGYFMRVSKASILNVNRIYSITRNISTCVVEFQNSRKQVYVSRHYYKPLKAKLEEKRMRG